MQFKLFTYYDAVNLEFEVNDWLKENDHLIEVKSTHFSTSTESERVDDDRVIQHVKYHAAIFYREL